MHRLATFSILIGCGRHDFDARGDGARPAPDVSPEDACATCNAGLVAHWPMDETAGATAVDVVGGRNAMMGGLAWSWSPQGARGGAAAYDWGYAEVAWDLPSTIGDAFTIALWNDPTPPSRAFARHFAMFYWDGASHGAFIMDNGNGNGVRCAANIANTFVWLAREDVFDATGWRHVACTFDGSTLRVYANGVLVDSYAQSGTVSTTEPLQVGIGASIYPDGTTQNETFGRIDDVRVYSRALTEAELTALATL